MNNASDILPSQIMTDRLVLRQYVESDSEALLAASIRNRSHLMEYEADNAILSITDLNSAASLIADITVDWKEGKHFFVGVFSKETDEFVGQIYIGPGDLNVPEFRVGYMVDVQHEGKGYVTESVSRMIDILFKQLGAYRISIECDDTNVRSVSVAERCGFVREGHLRENKIHPDGRRSGTIFFGLLETD